MTTIPRQQGFTLIEVLAVMLVLVAIASVTVESSKDFVFQNRYQVTQDRYDKIKQAIIGNPNQTINGHPSVSGFVADMGRLPYCLRELIDGTNCNSSATDAGYCSDHSVSPHDICLSTTGNTWKDLNWQAGYCLNNSYTTQASCVSNASTWVSLGYGWRGPYIETTGDPTKPDALADGWGRIADHICHDATGVQAIFTDATSCTNAGYTWNTVTTDNNYGWYFNNNGNTAINLLSYGKDGLYDVATAPASDYDKDYLQSPLYTVSTSDWQATLPTTASVTITPAPAPATAIFTNATTATIGGVSATVSNTVSTITATATLSPISQPICLSIFTNTSSSPIQSSNPQTLTYTPTATAAIPVATATYPVTVSATVTATPTLTPSFTLTPTSLAFGQIAFSINRYDVTATPACTNTIVPSAFNTSPKILTLLPRHTVDFGYLTW